MNALFWKHLLGNNLSENLNFWSLCMKYIIPLTRIMKLGEISSIYQKLWTRYSIKQLLLDEDLSSNFLCNPKLFPDDTSFFSIVKKVLEL